MCVTDHHDMTVAVKVALNPNTTNQPTHFIEQDLHMMLCSVHTSTDAYNILVSFLTSSFIVSLYILNCNNFIMKTEVPTNVFLKIFNKSQNSS